jgi:transcription initiation factor TFIIIB Brf1 subunit/transcription initiation factor TFIIB
LAGEQRAAAPTPDHVARSGCDGPDGSLFSISSDADTAQGSASACARLLSDPELRQRLVDAAHELYPDAYDREVVEGRIAAVAQAARDAAAARRP